MTDTTPVWEAIFGPSGPNFPKLFRGGGYREPRKQHIGRFLLQHLQSKGLETLSFDTMGYAPGVFSKKKKKKNISTRMGGDVYISCLPGAPIKVNLWQYYAS